MPGLPAGMEWIIILVIVILVFGVGRVAKIGGEMGNAIRLRGVNGRGEGLSGDKKDEKKAAEEPKKDDPAS